MFRASPWVSYNPSTMDDDVDMDAPLISTLPQETTPPPQQPRKPAARKKKPAQPPPPWPRPQAPTSEDDVADEGEDEEDQLIDDDDDVKPPLASASVSISAKGTEAGSKKKAPAKRKSRKEGTEDEGKKRKKEKLSHPSGSLTVAQSTPISLEASSSGSHDDAGDTVAGTDHQAKSPKKKSTPRKNPAPKPVKPKPTKLKMVIPALSSVIADDAISVMSEGGFTGTAASSPVTAHFDGTTPDPEIPPPSSPPALPPVLLAEEPNLENVPLPIYPLPTKPFPVQPPPKVATGFAPPIPLDKSGKKVRHWRTAVREIRGIGGGRWFARSWVGDKESEYATAAAAKEAEKPEKAPYPFPKLNSSASAPPGGRGGSKKGKGASSLNASAAPSRDGSVLPDSNQVPITSTVRAPTKMRIQQLPQDASEPPESDAAMDIDPTPVVGPSES